MSSYENRDCSKRVAILYGASIFTCRRCRGLAYDSRREAAHQRALHRTQAIRMKLGVSASLAELFPAKPKGMQWRTYGRLKREAGEAQDRCWPPWVLKMTQWAKM